MKSVKTLEKLIPNLFNFILNNIQFTKVDDSSSVMTSQEIMIEILNSISVHGSKLIKLKLSKINLKNEQIIPLITETLCIAQNLILLDLSWC